MHSLNHSPCSAFTNQFQKLNLNFSPVEAQKLKFYPVVDTVEWVNKLAQWGVKTIQLRLKNKSRGQVLEEALEAQKICTFYGTQFFLNDYWELALEFPFYGVHLGFEDLQEANLIELEKKGLRVGLSTHSFFELSTAIALNPSYIALGPIYNTTLKKMRFEPQGIQRITQWRNFMPKTIPLVAIGGIVFEQAKLIYEAGANSIAVVSDVTQANNPYERVLQYEQLTS